MDDASLFVYETSFPSHKEVDRSFAKEDELYFGGRHTFISINRFIFEPTLHYIRTYHVRVEYILTLPYARSLFCCK